MQINEIRENLEQAQSLLNQFLSDERNLDKIAAAGELMVRSVSGGGRIISCGNGGSMCDAMHFAEELAGRYREDRPPIPAIAISDPSYITCAGNDYGFEQVFSRYVEGSGNSGDVLLAISTSGNSVNVVRAAETARAKGMKIVAMTGRTGGKLASLCDIELRAPMSEYADRAQEIHVKIIHALILYIEKNL